MATLGARIDALYALDVQVDKKMAEIAKIKKERAALELKLLKEFEKEEIDGTKGRKGVASIRRTSHPSIKDRRQFFKYVRRNRAWDLLQNRIASKAYFDRLEEGEKIPGVSVFENTKISVRKRS